MSLTPIPSSYQQNGMNLYLNGLTVSVASNTTLSVAAGQCRDMTNTFDINVGNYLGNGNQALTANSATVINAAINGVNGLDTGSLAASTWYYIYAIADQAGYNQPALLLSASSTAPVLPNLALGAAYPSGYSLYRIIGVAKTDGSSHFLTFYMSERGQNRRIQWDVPQTVTVTGSGTSTTYLAMSLLPGVPPVFFDEVQLYVAFTPGGAGDTVKFQPTGGTGDYHTITGISTVIQDQQFEILPLVASSLPEVSYKVATATLNTVLVQAFNLHL